MALLRNSAICFVAIVGATEVENTAFAGFFESFDADADGKLQEVEFMRKLDEHLAETGWTEGAVEEEKMRVRKGFKAADVDGDGELGQEEGLSLLQFIEEGQEQGDLESVIEHIDEDKNGRLVLTELLSTFGAEDETLDGEAEILIRQAFQKADGDLNGELAGEEIANFMSLMEQAEEGHDADELDSLMHHVDLDNNGGLSLVELFKGYRALEDSPTEEEQAVIRKAFEKADENGDEELQGEEAVSFLSIMEGLEEGEDEEEDEEDTASETGDEPDDLDDEFDEADMEEGTAEANEEAEVDFEFLELDANNDGKIALAEIHQEAESTEERALFERFFNEADSDHDGALTKKEMQHFLTAMELHQERLEMDDY